MSFCVFAHIRSKNGDVDYNFLAKITQNSRVFRNFATTFSNFLMSDRA